MKEKLDKLAFIKIKKFCSANITVKKMKRQATGWKKTFAKHISGKGFVSKEYKELLKLNDKKTTALAGVAQWIECRPMNQKVTGSNPSQGTCLGCWPGSQLGAG